MTQKSSSKPSGNTTKKSTSLPTIANCEGCGVCCFHMGYPAFILPSEPMTDEEIDVNPELVKRIEQDPKYREDLKKGHPGESYWHSLPNELRQEWEAYVSDYTLPQYGGDTDSLDGPCVWLDVETRQCKHHEHRPQVCRDFETGSARCHEWRHFYQDKIKS